MSAGVSQTGFDPVAAPGSGPERPNVSECISRVLRGDAEAFRPLVVAHGPAVFGLCRRLLDGNRTDADEVTQETFVNAYRYLPTLQDPERFQPWLYQIARSLCRDLRRRRAAEDRALERWGERTSRERLLRETEGGEGTMVSALRDLPDEEREVLELRYYEGLPYEEIARRLNVSFAQVDHRIRKARARLSRRLAVRQKLETG